MEYRQAGSDYLARSSVVKSLFKVAKAGLRIMRSPLCVHSDEPCGCTEICGFIMLCVRRAHPV